MKLATCFFIAISLFLLFACKPKAEPVYFQPENTTARIEKEVSSMNLKVCDIDGTKYYIWDYFIYVLASTNISYVMTWVGTYKQAQNQSNWELVPHNKRDNIYWDTLDWIAAGELPVGTKIVCNETQTVPKPFYKFYSVYKPLYEKTLKSKNITNISRETV
ncbi:MAG: hypothetical protein QXK37_02425 [Candidatus Woesearchaeota archaeon]